MANRIIMTGCSFKGGDGSTAIRLRGDDYDLNLANTKFNTTVGIDIENSDSQLLALSGLLRQSDIDRAEFVHFIEQLQLVDDTVEKRENSATWIKNKLSIAADVTGLSQFIVALSASPKFHQIINVLFS